MDSIKRSVLIVAIVFYYISNGYNQSTAGKISTSGAIASEWSAWEDLYSDNTLKVKISFKLNPLDCGNTNKTSRFRYMIQGPLKPGRKYINWDLEYFDCTEMLVKKPYSLYIGSDSGNISGVLESSRYSIRAKALTKKNFNARLSNTVATQVVQQAMPSVQTSADAKDYLVLSSKRIVGGRKIKDESSSGMESHSDMWNISVTITNTSDKEINIKRFVLNPEVACTQTERVRAYPSESSWLPSGPVISGQSVCHFKIRPGESKEALFLCEEPDDTYTFKQSNNIYEDDKKIYTHCTIDISDLQEEIIAEFCQ
jgi:hypothetical protein